MSTNSKNLERLLNNLKHGMSLDTIGDDHDTMCQVLEEMIDIKQEQEWEENAKRAEKEAEAARIRNTGAAYC